MSKIKEVVDHAGLSLPLLPLNQENSCNKESSEISLNNNSFLVILLKETLDVMVVGKTEPCSIMPTTESVPLLLTHILPVTPVEPEHAINHHVPWILSPSVEELGSLEKLNSKLRVIKCHLPLPLMLPTGLTMVVVFSPTVPPESTTQSYLLDTPVNTGSSKTHGLNIGVKTDSSDLHQVILVPLPEIVLILIMISEKLSLINF